MSDIGAPAGASGAAGPRNVQLNPERAPALIAKWQKLLGKDLERIEVIYKADGVSVDLYGMGDFSRVDKDGDECPMSIAAFKAAKAEAEKPSADEAITAFKNKFELRLNLEFPADAGLTDASDASIQAFLAGRPLAQRRAMLMSNKQFKAAYPNGFAA
jgi:hypothetical protein